MFVTWFKNEFHIHDSRNGNIMFVKTMADEILDAQLSGNQLTITMKKRTHLYKRIGSTYAFSFWREISH